MITKEDKTKTLFDNLKKDKHKEREEALMAIHSRLKRLNSLITANGKQ